jgi:hypothetical protein
LNDDSMQVKHVEESSHSQTTSMQCQRHLNKPGRRQDFRLLGQ